ncbi:MAG TPA: Dabb family protein [Verrucomicrobiae bacterium]
MVSLQCGTNVGPENLNKGFTHCFALSFKSAADRDAYLKHPAHKAFGKVVGPVRSRNGRRVRDRLLGQGLNTMRDGNTLSRHRFRYSEIMKYKGV